VAGDLMFNTSMPTVNDSRKYFPFFDTEAKTSLYRPAMLAQRNFLALRQSHWR
jgi:hypothetical protein